MPTSSCLRPRLLLPACLLRLVVLSILITGLVFPSQGYAQVAAQENPPGNLIYMPLMMRPAEANWLVQSLDSPRLFGEIGSRALVMRSPDRPCLVYGNDHLYLKCYNGASWETQVVDPAAGVGRSASLALDSHGNISIAYFDETHGALKYARWSGSAWVIETVDSMTDPQTDQLALQGITSNKIGVGGYPSIAIDSANRPHISYFDFDHQMLKYAVYTGSGWQLETVDGSGNTGRFNSLRVDSTGLVYIAYYEATNRDLKLAERAFGAWGSPWKITTLDAAGDVGQYASLDLTRSGKPRVAYYDATNKRLKYWNGSTAQVVASGQVGEYASLALDLQDNPLIAYFDDANWDARLAWWNGSWNYRLIDSYDHAGRYTSLALDSTGKPSVVYYHSSENQLRYAAFNGSGFSVQALDVTANTGIYADLDLNSNNYPGIAYLNDSQSRLMYLEWDGSRWNKSVISSLNDTGVHVSLCIGPFNVPHVTFWQYRSGKETELRYVYRNKGEWHAETVDVGENVGFYSSLVVDSRGNAHVSYFDAAAGDLKYAFRSSKGWKTDVVDENGHVGEYTSLALDQYHNPWISYYDASHGDLKIARWNGANWAIQTVDSSGDVGVNSSLVLDSAGRPRIAYQDVANRRLKFAVWDGTKWNIQTIAPAGSVSNDVSLRLDAQDRAHISFYDDDSYNLKYAYQQPDGSWTVETIDAEGDVGRYNGLALTSGGLPRIAYYDATNGDLKYAIRK